MTQQSGESPAQLADRFLQRTAIGVLLAAASYALAAAIYLVGPETGAMLDKVKLFLSLLILIVVLPAFIRFFRLRGSGQCDCSGADSYIGDVFNKACVKGFSATFVLLILAGPASQKVLTQLPADFFLSTILALSLGVFGIAFFASIAADHVDEHDDFDTDHQA